MGCAVDLDDFGTGHSSITAIRRFALNRLKIDRSFIRDVDQNRDQQNLVTAILSLAERLGLETLAEGVETPAEHALLAQLGCGHVQGFVIAKPMPVEDLASWLVAQRETRAKALRIGVDDYLTKPFDEEELLARIAALGSGSRLAAAVQRRRAALANRIWLYM